MSTVTSRRKLIESLLAELDEMEDAVAGWQASGQASSTGIRAQQARYLDWYARARTWVLEADLAKFENMYNGGAVTPRIKSFFSNPLELNVFYNSENPSSLLSKWQNQFDRSFKASADTQREILVNALHGSAGPVQELAVLAEAFRRLPQYLAALRDTGSTGLRVPDIKNEKDLQGIVLAILRVMYDDVRPEDYISQYAGSRTRVDFLVGDAKILIETKMTRPSLLDKEVGNELLEDFGRYPNHPKFSGIFAFVYDPARLLKNPIGLQNDLTRTESGLVTRTIVVH